MSVSSAAAEAHLGAEPVLSEREQREGAVKGAAVAKARRSVSIVEAPKNVGLQVKGLFEQYAPLAYMMPWEILDYVEILSTYNPDYSQAVENVKMLANTGHTLFVEASSQRRQQNLKDRIDEKARTIQERHGGIDGLIEKLLDQATTFGAMCGEWTVSEDLDDVEDFVDVNPKHIRFFWEDEHWAPYQKVDAAGVEEAKKKGQKVRNGNCFGAETRIVTFDGIKEIGSLTGTRPLLLTRGGTWVGADVESFGEQRLYEVVVQSNRITKTIRATGDHGWFVYRGQYRRDRKQEWRLPTVDLKPGDELVSQFGRTPHHLSMSPWGVAHGITFGDGTCPSSDRNPASTVLFGEKDAALLKWFPHSPTKVVPGGIKVNGLPREWKRLPSWEESSSYLYGWLAGYFAADGCVDSNGHPFLSSACEENLKFAEDVCARLGIAVAGVRQVLRKGFGAAESPLYQLSFRQGALDEDFFLLPAHRQRWRPASRRWDSWKVVKVEATEAFEEVFCAVVPRTHSFVLEGNILTSNCIKLNELTFHYYAFDAAPGSPYGTPPFLAALTSIAIQQDMVSNLAQIVKKIGLLGIVDLSVKGLPMKPNESQEQYETRAGKYLDDYVTVIEDMVKDGGIVHFDDVDVDTWQIGGNAAGATAIFKQIEELIFSGLKSMPSLQGRSYSTTETYAGVAYEITLRNTAKYQRAVRRMIESGYWLMASLWGESPDKIKIKFNSNKTLSRLQDAQAEKTEIYNAILLWLIGLLDQAGVAQRLGQSDPKTQMEQPPPGLVSQAQAKFAEEALQTGFGTHTRNDDKMEVEPDGQEDEDDED